MSDIANAIQERTRQLALTVFRFFKKRQDVDRVVRYQVSKSVSSVAANYVACRAARSRREYYAKLCIVVEEATETAFWLNFLLDLDPDLERDGLGKMRDEALELSKIFSSSRKTTKAGLSKKPR